MGRALSGWGMARIGSWGGRRLAHDRSTRNETLLALHVREARLTRVFNRPELRKAVRRPLGASFGVINVRLLVGLAHPKAVHVFTLDVVLPAPRPGVLQSTTQSLVVIAFEVAIGGVVVVQVRFRPYVTRKGVPGHFPGACTAFFDFPDTRAGRNPFANAVGGVQPHFVVEEAVLTARQEVVIACPFDCLSLTRRRRRGRGALPRLSARLAFSCQPPITS